MLMQEQEEVVAISAAGAIAEPVCQSCLPHCRRVVPFCEARWNDDLGCNLTAAYDAHAGGN